MEPRRFRRVTMEVLTVPLLLYRPRYPTRPGKDIMARGIQATSLRNPASRERNDQRTSRSSVTRDVLSQRKNVLVLLQGRLCQGAL